ncbi:RnfH family protein [Verminephrobacter eiseniae]|uniref:RnfH family protein n=1 Tax=Verminephrobacter eiseniae TaxID=364317 RepID=UPI002237441C|nr:RnfH family protein [Verminephrobacter eiseniae]MCW5237230.1 RnfH family protein [Verminephrobacter eiseniae]
MADDTDDSATRATMQVTVVLCVAPRQTQEWTLELPIGATLDDAIRASGAARQGASGTAPRDDAGGRPASLGIWGQTVGPDAPLQHLDRIEIYRPLKVDPKLARRQRFARQGARTAGLFARQRAGKPG